jgi:hypothetical protein
MARRTAGRVPVIDARAPRFNQGVIAAACVAALLSGWWPLLALAGLQLGLTLTFGPRVCLACLAYFKLIQPRLGAGPIKDARPVRFANFVGFVFLAVASFARVMGHAQLGWALAGLVGALALLAAVSGVCVGCEMYRWLAFVRGIRLRKVARIDLSEIGAAPQDGLVVQFTHPRCSDCQSLERELSAKGTPLALVDVSVRPDLARKYAVTLVPLAFRVAGDGRILSRVAI